MLASRKTSAAATNTCASWASETTERVTGRHVDADDVLGVETPRELVESIRTLKAEQATSLEHPRAPMDNARSSSFGQVYDAPGKPALQTGLALLLDDPAHPDHAWYQQALQGVHALDSQHGRVPDVHSDQLAGALAVHARQAGMTGVDHVLNNQDGSRVVAIRTGRPGAAPGRRGHVARHGQAAGTQYRADGGVRAGHTHANRAVIHVATGPARAPVRLMSGSHDARFD